VSCRNQRAKGFFMQKINRMKVKKKFHGNRSHGMSYHPLYIVWDNIKARCYNKNNHAYNDYGNRGILMCDEWIDNAKAFIEWSLLNGYKKGLDIDRIDNEAGYNPKNCRFVTHRINSLNRRIFKNNKSGYTGVHKEGKMWRARITIKSKKISVGFFNTAGEAAIARNKYIVDNVLTNYKVQKL
jgi:hypothetical protein